MNDATDWKNNGVKVISGDHLDINTPQTPGMNRAAAINYATAGADKLWAGTVAIHPDAKTGVHHHGALESIIYIISGKARMRWGNSLEYMCEAGPLLGYSGSRFGARLGPFWDPFRGHF